ncbi:hypothetical protein FRC03_001267 [Tulasnella sp. 419]|nr:hypothetical protein FRC03_001267 [Tulasnella sp. 419]
MVYSLPVLSQGALVALNESPLSVHRATVKELTQLCLDQGFVLPGVYTIRSVLSRMAVDMQGPGQDGATPIVNYQLNSAKSQQWIIQATEKGYTIQNLETGTYMSLPDGIEPTPAVQLAGNPQPREWDITSEGHYFVIRLVSDKNFAMDLKAGSSENNNPIITYGCHKGVTQQWILSPV